MKIKGLIEKDKIILLDYIKKNLEENGCLEDFKDIKRFDDIVCFIQDFGDFTESVDSNYITKTYFIEVGNKVFNIDSSQYRKDGGLCDTQWSDEIYVTKSKKKKSVKKKVVKKVAKKTIKKSTKKTVKNKK